MELPHITGIHWLCSIDFHNVLDVADSTRQHMLQVISSTCEALLTETGENLFHFVCLTRSPTGYSGKSYALEKLAQPVPGLSAEQSRDWRTPGVHVDDSPDICDSFGHLELFHPNFVRSTWKKKNRRRNPPLAPCPVFDHFMDTRGVPDRLGLVSLTRRTSEVIYVILAGAFPLLLATCAVASACATGDFRIRCNRVRPPLAPFGCPIPFFPQCPAAIRATGVQRQRG